MPYIKKDRRDALDNVQGEFPDNVGELNYKITDLIQDYYIYHGKGYARVNDVLGALEGAKLEFYRRVAAPYEDKKIEENGDVYHV